MRGILYGPYARQVTPHKLKFWFVLGEEDKPRRYEVTADALDRKTRARHRPIYLGRVPRLASNFIDYLIPDNYEDLPSLSFPRFKRDDLATAALTLLVPSDIADVTRILMIGQLPPPIMATTENPYAPQGCNRSAHPLPRR